MTECLIYILVFIDKDNIKSCPKTCKYRKHMLAPNNVKQQNCEILKTKKKKQKKKNKKRKEKGVNFKCDHLIFLPVKI